MFHSFRELEVGGTYDFDVCIAGAGAAGLAMAHEFLSGGYRVCILESGGFEFENEVQDLYQGQNVGAPYFDLDVCRLRYFGGTTNHWAGYCLPFTDKSFARHEWIPHSGWPIRYSDVAEHYRRAIDWIGLDPAYWNPEHVSRKLEGDLIVDETSTFQSDFRVILPARPGETMREPIASSASVNVFLHANLVEILTDPTARTVTGFAVAPLGGGRSLVRARRYVLALGGIENARLLLNSNAVQSEGLANGKDLVGRFFCDHTWIAGGELLSVRNGEPFRLYIRQQSTDRQDAIGYLRPRPDVQRAQRISDAHVRVDRIDNRIAEVPGGASLKAILSGQWISGDDEETLAGHLGNVLSNFDEMADHSGRRLWYGRLDDKMAVRVSFEPAPNPDSRVTLNSTRDALGLRRVDLDWQFTELDEHTAAWVTDAFARFVGANGLGRFRPAASDEDFRDRIGGTRHHIGTTRMSDTPATGVVDRDCRVHGIDNLYVAGSSVFTTAGHGTPTLLIAALAMRLADKLKEDLA